MSKRLTIEYIKEELKSINPNIKIISDTYRNNREKLKCVCLLDGYEFEMNWNKLKAGRGCWKCGGSIKLTIDEIKLKLLSINPNIEILSNQYKNNNEKLKCRCLIDGYEWNASWSTIGRGHGCLCCATNRSKFDIGLIKNELLLINPSIEIIDNNYTSSRDKLKCRCLLDGNIFYMSWNSIQSGHGCKECATKAKSGSNSVFWSGGMTEIKLYLRDSIRQWKKDSMSECNYKCVISDSDFNVIHHIHNFKEIFDEVFLNTGIPKYQTVKEYTEKELTALRVENNRLHYKYGLGVCLSGEIHNEFHKIYGVKNNTLEQFNEFKNNYINQNKKEAS